jgi:hypothetical protein
MSSKPAQGFPVHLPPKLAFCRDSAQRKAWVRGKLECGGVVTDVGMWLAGLDEPKELIRSLIRDGLRIITFRKTVLDASDERHTTLAWRLKGVETDAV